MSEEAPATTEAPPEVKPADWSETVLKQTEEAPPVQTPPPKEPPLKTEPKPKIPDALFEKKETKVIGEPESEVAKIQAPDFKNPETKKGWDALHSKASELEKKVWAAEKELSGAREGSKKAQELEAKIKEYEDKLTAISKTADEYKSIVRETALERDPDYRRTYVDTRKNLVAEGKQIADECDIDSAAVEAALLLPDGKARTKAIEVAISDLSNFQQGRIGEVLTKIARLDREAAEQKSDPDAYFRRQEQAWKDQQIEKARKDAEEFARAYHVAERDLSETMLAFRKLEGEEHKEWNEKGEAMKMKARQFWETNKDPQRAAEVTIKGFAAEFYEQAYQDVRDELSTTKAKLAEREKELEKLYGTGPKTDGAGAAPSTGQFEDWATQLGRTAGLK